MKTISIQTPLFLATQQIQHQAEKSIWDGKTPNNYFFGCMWYLQEFGANLVYTKESGYHSGGWWKNPDYERCYHLSLSFDGGRDKKAETKILEKLFKEYRNLLWIEPPYSEAGKSKEVWHYRLFCNEFWMPIKPRGEVYSTQFTERGWKSFSDLNQK